MQRRVIMGPMDSSQYNNNHFMMPGWNMHIVMAHALKRDPLIDWKWIKDRSREKPKPSNMHWVPGRVLVLRPEKIVLFDTTKKAHKARV